MELGIKMDITEKSKNRLSTLCLLFASVGLNIFLIRINYLYSFTTTTTISITKQQNSISWTKSAAEEAERVASVSCSGHGRAYLDGYIVDGKPICECNSCYNGSDCSQFLPACAADADSGDPLFLEPFWMQHADSSAVLVAGWHRMSYTFSDGSYISKELENDIRRLHDIAKNAVTKDSYIIFGGGSTQLLSAAVYALSMNLSSPASVVAASPSYPLYKTQTNFFQTVHFEYEGDPLLLKNYSSTEANVIEFVTSPNNPDGNLRQAVSKGPSVKPIYDHAYYWPHFTAIPSPADENLMIFTISKLTGHAGTRLGWAIVKEKQVYDRMASYISMAEMGMSREAQLRALKLMKAILQGNGTEIFHFAYKKMRERWVRINDVVSLSDRFTLQEIPLHYCSFFDKVREPSPAYAWLKCEREEDEDCNSVLSAANIIGRSGSLFNAEKRYVRLSLLKSDDDFNLLLRRLKELVSKDNIGPKII